MEHRGENIMTKDKLLAVGERYDALISADKAADAAYRRGGERLLVEVLFWVLRRSSRSRRWP
jgi:hypothetical protein